MGATDGVHVDRTPQELAVREELTTSDPRGYLDALGSERTYGVLVVRVCFAKPWLASST